MSERIWAQRPRPVTAGDAAVLAVWNPVTPAELTRARRQLSAALHDGARPPATAEDAVERLLLCHEELGSNAVRHGRLPVRVEVLAGHPRRRHLLVLSRGPIPQPGAKAGTAVSTLHPGGVEPPRDSMSLRRAEQDHARATFAVYCSQ